MKRIHLWAPGVEPSQGGIQAYSRELLLAARNFADVEVHCRSGRSALRFAIGALGRAAVQRPAAILSTHLNFSPLALILKRFARIPYAVSLHGIEAWKVENPRRQKALCRANLLLPVSECTRERAQAALGHVEGQWQLLHNTFDETRFSPGPKPPELLAKFRLTASCPVILSVGRMDAREAYKGQDRVLQSLPEVLRQVPDSRYVLVGDGSDRPRLERLAGELGVSQNVHFAGKVPDEDLPGYYRLCDVFAMPSTGEGFGIAYLEALGSGRPVIAGNRDAGRDALRNGELGVLVDPDDRGALSAALLACLTRSHSNSLIFHPDALRERTLACFGHDAFRLRVGEILNCL